MPAASTTQTSPYQVLASVLEFDVAGATELTIRSVASLANGSWGNFSSAVVSPQNNWRLNDQSSFATHVRGYWRKSTVLLLVPQYECNPNPPPPSFKDYQFCEETSEESGYFSVGSSLAIGTTNVAGSTRNPAGYGANFVFNGSYLNSHFSIPGLFGLAIRARNIPAKYFGAAQVALPATGPQVRTPPIPQPLQVPYAHPERGYVLTKGHPSADENGGLPIAPGESRAFQLRLANGGGCGTPANLVLSRRGVWSMWEEPTVVTD